MNPDNIYFLNTPVEIQEECYYYVVEYLSQLNQLNENDIIYLSFTQIFNMNHKGFFKVYISSQIESNEAFNRQPDFLIFIK